MLCRAWRPGAPWTWGGPPPRSASSPRASMVPSLRTTWWFSGCTATTTSCTRTASCVTGRTRPCSWPWPIRPRLVPGAVPHLYLLLLLTACALLPGGSASGGGPVLPPRLRGPQELLGCVQQPLCVQAAASEGPRQLHPQGGRELQPVPEDGQEHLQRLRLQLQPLLLQRGLPAAPPGEIWGNVAVFDPQITLVTFANTPPQLPPPRPSLLTTSS